MAGTAFEGQELAAFSQEHTAIGALCHEAFVGKALVMKRFTPRARGRVGRIAKPFSNLTIVVRQVEEAA